MNEIILDMEEHDMTTPTVIEKIEALSQRLERAREIVADNKVRPVLGRGNKRTAPGLLACRECIIPWVNRDLHQQILDPTYSCLSLTHESKKNF